MIQLRVKKAHSVLEKMQGLIGKDKAEAFLLETHFGIHTFGLRFPIDVLILNSKHRVVYLKKNLVPYRVFFWNPRFSLVLELSEL